MYQVCQLHMAHLTFTLVDTAATASDMVLMLPTITSTAARQSKASYIDVSSKFSCFHAVEQAKEVRQIASWPLLYANIRINQYRLCNTQDNTRLGIEFRTRFS